MAHCPLRKNSLKNVGCQFFWVGRVCHKTKWSPLDKLAWVELWSLLFSLISVNLIKLKVPVSCKRWRSLRLRKMFSKHSVELVWNYFFWTPILNDLITLYNLMQLINLSQKTNRTWIFFFYYPKSVEKLV